MSKKMQKGFTLIELMIVVAIIGILAAIALPAYQDYTQKAKFSEVMSVSESYKTAVSLCYATTSDFNSCDAGSNGVPAADATGANIASVTVTNGVITITGEADTGGYTSVITPVASGAASIIWNQTGTCAAAGYCPN